MPHLPRRLPAALNLNQFVVAPKRPVKQQNVYRAKLSYQSFIESRNSGKITQPSAALTLKYKPQQRLIWRQCCRALGGDVGRVVSSSETGKHSIFVGSPVVEVSANGFPGMTSCHCTCFGTRCNIPNMLLPSRTMLRMERVE